MDTSGHNDGPAPLGWYCATHDAVVRDRALSPDACQAALVPLAIVADPVGIPEIADRLGVARNTVDHWKLRHGSFPAPRWQVGGRPAWDWTDIAGWATATGRLPHLATTTEETP